MSHQPSTTEQLIEKSKTAYNTIAHTIAPSTQTESTHEVKKRDLAKDDQGQACKKDSYQDQLNKAARGPTTMEQEEKTIIEKGTHPILLYSAFYADNRMRLTPLNLCRIES